MNTKKWSLLAVILIAIGVAGMAYQQFKFGDEDPYFQQRWTLDSLASLEVKSSYDMDVEFIKSPDGANYIEIKGNMAEDTIKKLKAASFTGPDVKLDMTENDDFSFLIINFQSTKQHMTVALADPDKALEQIKFELRSNNGNFSGIHAKDIELSTTSGNLTASSVIGESLEIEATSGNIKASDVQGETEIEIGSGNINVEQLKGNLDAKGTSGKITVNGIEGSLKAVLTSGDTKIDGLVGPATLKTTSGNVTLNGQRSDSLDISVGSGNVDLSADAEFKGIYDLKASSGDIKAPDSPLITKDVIKVRTTSGNIRVR